MAPLLRNRALAVTTIAFLLATAVLTGLAFAGSTMLEDRRVSVPLLFLTLVAGILALLGWATEQTRRQELAAEHDEERMRLEAEHSARGRAEGAPRPGRSGASRGGAESGIGASRARSGRPRADRPAGGPGEGTSRDAGGPRTEAPGAKSRAHGGAPLARSRRAGAPRRKGVGAPSP
jgi:hypothetical protein